MTLKNPLKRLSIKSPSIIKSLMDPATLDDLFSLAILEYLRTKGYSKFTRPAFTLMRSALLSKLLSLMARLQSLSEMNQRSEVTLLDLLQYLETVSSVHLPPSDPSKRLPPSDPPETSDLSPDSPQKPPPTPSPSPDSADLHDDFLSFLQASAHWAPPYTPTSHSRLIPELLGELTGQEPGEARVGEAELARDPEAREFRIEARRPLLFVRSSKDWEKRLFLFGPETEKGTAEFERPRVERSEFRDSRIEEKRVFELENCKLVAFDGEKEDRKEKEAERKIEEKTELNPLENEAKEVDSLNEFEITNNQMFK